MNRDMWHHVIVDTAVAQVGQHWDLEIDGDVYRFRVVAVDGGPDGPFNVLMELLVPRLKACD